MRADSSMDTEMMSVQGVGSHFQQQTGAPYQQQQLAGATSSSASPGSTTVKMNKIVACEIKVSIVLIRDENFDALEMSDQGEHCVDSR